MPRTTVLLVLAAAAALLAGSARGARPRTDAADAAACARLRHANAQIRQELALASQNDFYLRLDAERGTLALVLRGVSLAEHRITRLELGEPRIAFLGRGLPRDWDLVPLSGGQLDPARARDRVEVVAPAPAAPGAGGDVDANPPPIPATAEESYSVPSRYRIVFREGLTLEVRSTGGARNRSGWRRLLDAATLRAHDWLGALAWRRGDRVRLRVELAAEDSAALYRSLPPAVRLVLLSPAAD